MTCTDPRCLGGRHEHARLSPLQEAVFGADTRDVARWCALAAAEALQSDDAPTARQAVESALTVLARSGGDRDLGSRLCEAGAAMERGHDRLAFIVLARLVVERQDAVNEFEARLAADGATEEAA